MASIEVRLAALAAEIRRRKFANEGPVDALSQSLFELEGNLLGLDDLGKAAFLPRPTLPRPNRPFSWKT